MHDINLTIDTMLRAGMVLARLVLPEMVQRKEGQVVFMSSAHQFPAQPHPRALRRSYLRFWSVCSLFLR